MARVILGIREPEPTAALLNAIGAGRLAGLLWFRDALGEEVERAADRVGRLRSVWPPGIPCLFAIDEEGGLIQQLAGLRERSGERWPRLPSPRALGRGGDPAVAFAHGREVGRRIRRLGLDIALAPVVDLDPGPDSRVLGTRCIGDDPDRVARLGIAWLRGLASAGVRGCLKHFPGHGATRIDSHWSLPRVAEGEGGREHREPFSRIASEWRAQDGPPPAVLTAHLILDPSTLPATLDPAAVAKIPSSLGPVWTDSLEMGALAAYGDLLTRARAAAGAGCDLLVIGEEIAGGLQVAERFSPPPSDRLLDWSRSVAPPVPIPEPWPLEEIERAAAAGVRVGSDRPLPEGEWDWILPERFGLYGSVPAPVPATGGRRRIGRLIRYHTDRTDSLRQALAETPDRPALVGWIHRGPPDLETQRILASAQHRVRAVVHLLDGADPGLHPNTWWAETCGFGEGETTVLERLWREPTGPGQGFRSGSGFGD